MNILLPLETEIECEGRVYLGTRDRLDMLHGNWIPGDDADVYAFKAFKGVGINRVEITKTLSYKEIEYLKKEMIGATCDEIEANTAS